jgi:hypothetical protein
MNRKIAVSGAAAREVAEVVEDNAVPRVIAVPPVLVTMTFAEACCRGASDVEHDPGRMAGFGAIMRTMSACVLALSRR